ncbi:MAG: NADH-quinone oxidoreductase subunit NuoE [Desulfobacterales bacterium]|jgi:NADH-quinone oxidoreductase subunit E
MHHLGISEQLNNKIKSTEHPRELVLDVMLALQDHYGHLTDRAVEETARLLGMHPLEVEELATFYTFIYREPVGRYVIHICDSVVCWMEGYGRLRDYLQAKLGISLGGTTPDGLFSLLPVCCIGYCDRAPAMLINKQVYGELTPEKIDSILNLLKKEAQDALL